MGSGQFVLGQFGPGQFDTRTIWSRTYACKTLKSGSFSYAVDINLFQLGSTNPKKKKIPDPGAFWWGASPPTHFFSSKMFEHFCTNFIFKVFKFTWKTECAELKEKSNFRFFRFLFFEAPNCPSTELSGTELS